MKHTIFHIASRFLIATFAVLALAIALSSCETSTRYPAQLSLADSLMYAQPDSALAILTAYKDSVKTAPDATRMYFDLLLTTARDKNYLTHTSDSTVLRLVSYYEKHGPQTLLSRAYYIAGRVYDDLQNAPTALKYYQKSIDTTPKDSDYRQLALVYEQIGGVYMEQNLHKESISAYKKAYVYALKGNEKLYLPFVLRDLARAYVMLDNVDSTLYYYEKAFAMGDSTFKRKAVIHELASIYIQIQDYKNAHRILSYDKKAYLSWAKYYKGIGILDPARAMYVRALQMNNVNVKASAYRNLFQFEKAKDNNKKALYYLETANKYQDTIAERTKTVEVKRVESLYNYEKIKAERDKLAIKESRQRILVIILLSLLVIFLITGAILRVIIKDKIYFQKDQTKRSKYLRKIFQNSTPMPLEKLPLCLKIIEKTTTSDKSYNLKECYWEDFISEINSHYPDFTVRLCTLYPRIKDIEVIVCCLIRLGIANAAIATLLSRSSAAISNLRKRLYEKITGHPGTSRQLDDFIKKL